MQDTVEDNISTHWWDEEYYKVNEKMCTCKAKSFVPNFENDFDNGGRKDLVWIYKLIVSWTPLKPTSRFRNLYFFFSSLSKFLQPATGPNSISADHDDGNLAEIDMACIVEFFKSTGREPLSNINIVPNLIITTCLICQMWSFITKASVLVITSNMSAQCCGTWIH